MKRLLRTALLLLLSMLASGILLALTINAALELTNLRKTPMDFLPQEDTVAVLHAMDAERLRDWYPLFPSLQEIHRPGTVVAILPGSGTHVPLSFEDRESRDHGFSIGSFAVQGPSTMKPSLQTSDSIAELETYKAFNRSIGLKTPWSFLKTAVLPPPEGFLDRMVLEFLLHDAEHIGVLYERDAVTIKRFEQGKPLREAHVEVPLVHDPFLQLITYSAAEKWEHFFPLLPPSDAVILKGLRGSLLHFLGDDVSIDHDILPLAREPSSLQLSRSGSKIQFLFHGSMQPTPKRTTIIDRMHESFRRRLPHTKITRRVLDARFTSTDIRMDEEGHRRTQKHLDGWHVVSTTHRGVHDGLFTATNGAEVLVSNDASMLHGSLHPRTSLTLPREQSLKSPLLRGGGVINLKALQEVLEGWLPGSKTIVLPFTMSGTLLFSTEQYGPVVTTTMQMVQEDTGF